MRHITSTVGGFNRSLSLAVWQLDVAYGEAASYYQHKTSNTARRGGRGDPRGAPRRRQRKAPRLFGINEEKKKAMCLYGFIQTVSQIHVQNNPHMDWNSNTSSTGALCLSAHLCFAYLYTGINVMRELCKEAKEGAVFVRRNNLHRCAGKLFENAFHSGPVHTGAEIYVLPFF